MNMLLKKIKTSTSAAGLTRRENAIEEAAQACLLFAAKSYYTSQTHKNSSASSCSAEQIAKQLF